MSRIGPSIYLGIAFAVFAATAPTSAAQNNLPEDVRAMAKKVMMPVVLKVPGMDKVQVVQNLKYTKSDDPSVLMDIYVPPDLSENEKRPAVIVFHGGAKTDYTPKVQKLDPVNGPVRRNVHVERFAHLDRLYFRGFLVEAQVANIAARIVG
jgi:acetyl esterase/lipase